MSFFTDTAWGQFVLVFACLIAIRGLSWLMEAIAIRIRDGGK